MNSVAQVQMFDDCGRVGSVMVHIVPVRYLARAPVAAAIDSHDTVPVLHEEQHLGIPVVGAERPTMVENDRLGVLRAPILVENVYAILSGDEIHGYSSFRLRRLRRVGW